MGADVGAPDLLGSGSVIGAGLDRRVRTDGNDGDIRIGACACACVDGGGVRNVLVGLAPLGFLSRRFVWDENSWSDHSPF